MGQMIGQEQQPAANASVEQVLEQVNAEYQQIQKELKEIEILVKQSSSEVEKLAHRNAQLTNKVREVENNLDTVPREDIKNAYKAAQDGQGRLFMMRGQVEQLRSKQDYLKRYASSLQKVLDVSGALIATAETEVKEEESSSQVDEGSGIVKIIDAQESERRYLANQLHDGPAQALTNLILQAEICERLFDSDSSRAKKELGGLKDAVTQTFQKVREFIFELRPMMLDDLGLTPTLRKSIEDFEEKKGLHCNLKVLGRDARMSPYIEVTVFRVVQQLLKNIVQHAVASQIQLSLDIANDRVTSVVEDDGHGFNVEEVLKSARERKAMGLTTIKERIEMLGGEIFIDSSTGRGSRIEFWIPIKS